MRVSIGIHSQVRMLCFGFGVRERHTRYINVPRRGRSRLRAACFVTVFIASQVRSIFDYVTDLLAAAFCFSFSLFFWFHGMAQTECLCLL